MERGEGEGGGKGRRGRGKGRRGRGKGRRGRGKGRGEKGRDPKGWLTPHVPNPEKYPDPK